MMEITPKRMIVILVIAILLSGIPFWVSGFLASSRLSRSFSPGFKITTVVDLLEKDIQSEAEIYNDGNFMEYKCLYKDSCLSLVKAGTVAKPYTMNVSDMITVTSMAIPYPNRYITGMTFSLPCFLEAGTIGVSYNVYVLPMDDLYRIKMHIIGNVMAIEHKSSYEVKYKLRTHYVSFAFNQERETNLHYSIGVAGPLTYADFTFKIDPKTNSFYIIVATKSWNPTKE